MSARAVDWLWQRAKGPDRPVLLAGLTIRVADVLTLGYAIPIVWSHFPHPGWSLLLAVALVVHAVVTSGWWLYRREVGRGTLAIDLPVGAVALVLGDLLQHPEAGGWTNFPFPYTLLLGLVLGLTCRTWWGTLLAATAWGATSAVAGDLILGKPPSAVLYLAASFVLNPLVGWASARLLRRGTAELAAMQAVALRNSAELATEQERHRHAQALHDRVLQTMETLTRGDTLARDDIVGGALVADDALAARLAVEAAWLRRFVETGEADQSEDLASALADTTRLVARTGVDVQLNDAAIRLAGEGATALPRQTVQPLLAALHQVLVAFAGTPADLVVHATPERGGLLVTVLATRPGMVPPDPDEVDGARSQLAQVGGELRLEPVPYAELWVPGPGDG